MGKAPGTPLSGEGPLNGMLSAQHSPQTELTPSLQRLPSGGYDASTISYNTVQSDDPLQVRRCLPFSLYNAHWTRQQFGVDPVYGLNGNGVENGRFNSFSTGSTALYHHHGSRYGLGMNGRANGADSKMGGLHGPKHKRGDVDRECKWAHLLSVRSGLTYGVKSIVSQARVWRICRARFLRSAKINMGAATCRRSWRKVCLNIGI